MNHETSENKSAEIDVNQGTLEVKETTGTLPVFEEKDWNEYQECWLHPQPLQSDYPVYMLIILIDLCEGDDEEADDIIAKHGYRYMADIAIVSPEWAKHSIDKTGRSLLDEILTTSGISDEDLVEYKKDPEFELNEMVQQGYYATVWNGNGNDHDKLLNEAIKQSVGPKGLLGFYLDRQQNDIGATGWDILAGNTWGSDYPDQCHYTTEDAEEVREREVQEAGPSATPITNPDDAFKAPDMSSFETEEIEKATNLTHVGTFFVDSSGCGGANERALTPNQFKAKIQELLDIGNTLYGAITGVGQFQVYVSIFKGGE